MEGSFDKVPQALRNTLAGFAFLAFLLFPRVPAGEGGRLLGGRDEHVRTSAHMCACVYSMKACVIVQ